jgi:hypothetical protein
MLRDSGGHESDVMAEGSGWWRGHGRLFAHSAPLRHIASVFSAALCSGGRSISPRAAHGALQLPGDQAGKFVVCIATPASLCLADFFSSSTLPVHWGNVGWGRRPLEIPLFLLAFTSLWTAAYLTDFVPTRS